MEKPNFSAGPNMCDLDNCIASIDAMLIQNNQSTIGVSKQYNIDQDLMNSYDDSPSSPHN